jgi:colanic acid/amylovoran biosynthesis protein
MKNLKKNERVPSIGLMGTPVDCDNRGVLALGSSLVELTLDVIPQARVSFLVGSRNEAPVRIRVGDGLREIPVVNYRLSLRSDWRTHLFWIFLLSLIYRLIPISGVRRAIKSTTPWIRTVAEADMVGDICGGDSFSDIYGVPRFLLNSIEMLSVIIVRGDIVLLPQTYGPFSNSIARAVARWITRHASSILVRDRKGIDFVKSLIGRDCGEVNYCPDVAFALRAECPTEVQVDPPLPSDSGTGIIGFNVNGLMYNGGYTRDDMFSLKLDYQAFLPDLLVSLLNEQGNRLLLIPHTYGTEGTVESDLDSSIKVRDALPEKLRHRVHVVTGNYDQHELKGIIGKCDFFIGSRMHTCIAALSQAIPCIGIAYSYKFSGVFDSVGMGDWVVDGRIVDNQTAMDRILSLYREKEKARQKLVRESIQARNELRDAYGQLLSSATRD